MVFKLHLLKALFAGFFCLTATVWPSDRKMTGELERPIIYLQPNTAQLFTELYQAYELLNPPAKTVFESALYLDQSTYPSLLPMQPANQAIFEHASQVLSEFHERVQDLELYIDPNKPKPFFYTAVGSKQLIVALVYGIAMSEPDKKFLFVEQAPFYSGHPNAVAELFKYPNARFQAFHDPSEIQLGPDEVLVEFVTSPNNPDGKFRRPLTDASILIADFVFASSAFGDRGTGYVDDNIKWVREARSKGKHVFSFNSASKQFGKTGARCGYTWYPIYDPYAVLIFKKFFNFISFSTVAAGSTGLAEFLNLIQAFLDLPDTGRSLRQDGNKSLKMRHELVKRELLSRYPGTLVISIPGSPTFFAKIKDSRIPNKRASDVLFEDLDVFVNNGEPMGETNEFIRLNLSGYSQGLVEFLNRLAGQNKYAVKDVFIASLDRCNSCIVASKSLPNTVYIVNPGDCRIDADANNGPLEIYFPPFIDYEGSRVFSVKKIDRSDHPVVVKARNVTMALKKQDESVDLQWSETFYRQGKWQIVNRSPQGR
ncbi:MAG: aminotransferase class I/II-fold pyridoxal phosphate-dependent enzyme [Parachlamydiales bacterium]|nr:aminotransferase class I/II-fold pyridoxal phosphate-dependent enzyme [Candidatus Acheromyda pituitae]